MADDLKTPFSLVLPNDLLNYATDIADRKMGRVEREMQQDSEAYPEYARAYEDRENAEEFLIQKYHCDPMEIDHLESAMNATGASLAIEMYKRGVLDGGRIYHAFVAGELPRKEEKLCARK